VGLATVLSCLEGGVRVLAIEAGKTFFFQRAEAVELADRNGLTLLAV
jgi:hypothetical protein